MANSNRSQYNIWWGPPKKFSATIEERKISWLELFYDLVYVIVISKTTHLLVMNPGAEGIIDYLLFFVMIFWGWINGSMYHDLHGSLGIRTRFMTLWQMMAVAALATTMSGAPSVFIFRVIVALAFLQAFITYLWWSVGLYDKGHRKLNGPYTWCYLCALVLIVATLFIPQPYKRILFAVALVFNYLPPFLTGSILGRKHLNLNLSPGMVERLGSFTIILFGEVILGVINGASDAKVLNAEVWKCFAMGILVVFALWWIFFSIIADREIESGFLKGQITSILYIPALASLGILGATFSGLINSVNDHGIPGHSFSISELFGVSLSIFLISILAISRYLYYPKEYTRARKIIARFIIGSAIAVLLVTFLIESLSLINYLLLIFCSLFLIITIITRMWFKVEVWRLNEEAGKK